MLKRRKKAVGDENAPNKKVRNAKTVVVDGIKFRSKLESVMYLELRKLGVPFNYEVEKFMLMNGFKFRNETIRPITLLPDFSHDKYVLECKGHETETWKLKWKLFKRHLFEQGDERPLFLVYRQKDCAGIALQLLALYK